MNVDDATRFAADLEFVNLLALPSYVRELHSAGYLQNPAFLEYLRYLQYWARPPYVQHILSTQSLFYLQNLLDPEFVNQLAAPAAEINPPNQGGLNIMAYYGMQSDDYILDSYSRKTGI